MSIQEGTYRYTTKLNPFEKDAAWNSRGYIFENKFLTGFSHVNLSGVGCPDLGVLLLMPTTGALELERVPGHMVVIGGGVIGVEYASMFAELGVEVTLVDRHARLLDFCDAEIVDELVHQMRAKRVVFRLGEAVHEIVPPKDGAGPVEILLESGKRVVAEKE